MEARMVARRLRRLAHMLELAGENPFKIRAFTGGAAAVERTHDLAARVAEGRLREVKGIGPALAEVIVELVTTGRAAVETELRARVPAGVQELARLPGLGPSRLNTLRAELDVHDLDALEAACHADRLATTPGLGPKVQEKLREALNGVRAHRGWYLSIEAEAEAHHLSRVLAASPEVSQVAIAGPLARGHGTVRGLELVLASPMPEAALDLLAALGGLVVLARMPGEARVQLETGMPATVRAVAPPAFVRAGVEASSDAVHREALRLRAAERGLAWETFEPASEPELYARLELDFHPVELREGLPGKVGPLVSGSDLRGAWHVHTTYSDGVGTLEEMVQGARDLGWEYLGLADHSRSATYAGGLTVERVREQHAHVERLAEVGGMQVLRGIESDILADGSLDYPAEVLDAFDFVVASVHIRHGMDREAMTARIVKAMQDPHVLVVGHPTGRILLERSGYELDLDRIFATAVETGVALEINASPERLDLDAGMVRQAASAGVRFAINPDAHSVFGLQDLRRGVAIARQAGLPPEAILNTRSWSAVRPRR